MEFYTIKDIAKKINLNEETIRRWIREGKLKGENIGGRTGYRISKKEFELFILNNKKLMGIAPNIDATATDISDDYILDEDNKSENVDNNANNLFEILKNSGNKNNNDLKFELMEYEYKLQIKKKNVMNELARIKNELDLIEYELETINNIKDNKR